MPGTEVPGKLNREASRLGDVGSWEGTRADNRQNAAMQHSNPKIGGKSAQFHNELSMTAMQNLHDWPRKAREGRQRAARTTSSIRKSRSTVTFFDLRNSSG